MLGDDTMTELILGKEISAEIYGELKERVSDLKSKGVMPCLAVILVGEDPASMSYVRSKSRMCDTLGIKSINIEMPKDTTQEELMQTIRELNEDPKVHGFLVQLPLPSHLDEGQVIEAISPDKDVDCFHPMNVGRILVGDPDFLPATPAGIQQMLIRSKIETSGKHVVIIGRSTIVGKPLAAIMLQKGVGADSTVTVVHSRTKNLSEITRQADILIAAIGRPGFVTEDMVKEGAVVIDVGTNWIEDPSHPKGKRMVGDVDFDTVKDKTTAITPVPGGVGPMTICMLMANAVRAAEKAAGVRKC